MAHHSSVGLQVEPPQKPYQRDALSLDAVREMRDGGQNEDWRHRATCRDLPPSLFFPTRDEFTAEARVQALLVCARCPVRTNCLVEALAQEIDVEGVWGGFYFPPRKGGDSRRKLALRRAREWLFARQVVESDIAGRKLEMRRTREWLTEESDIKKVQPSVTSVTSA